MARIVLGLGANLGDRQAALQSVVDAMPPRFTNIQASRVYSSPPWGVTDQPPFLNAVVAADTDLSPQQVLQFAQECESNAGRRRAQRWGPRTLDVDVIAYGDLHQEDPVLTLPHPRARERAFVLVGVLEVEPQLRLDPHADVSELLDQSDQQGIVPVSELRIPS